MPRSVLPRAIVEMRELEVLIRRAPDAYTRMLRIQELEALRRRLAPRRPA